MQRIDAPREAPSRLAACPLFAGHDAAELAALTDSVTWWSVAGGDRVVTEGDEADAAYVVGFGRLEAHRADTLLAERGPGDLIGETGLLGLGRRTATVSAVRDSVLARLDAEQLAALAESRPRLAMDLASEIARRAAAAPDGSLRLRPPKLVAVVPLGSGVEVSELVQRLADSCPPRTRVAAVTGSVLESWSRASEGAAALSERLAACEAEQDLVLLAASLDDELSAVVLRQVDLVLAAGRVGAAPQPGRAAVLGALRRPVQLLLTRAGGAVPDLAGWSEVLDAAARGRPVLHLEDRRQGDAERISRRLTGRSVGVVLGGGGARGFAHIGALRALREAGIPVDRIGGSSMGSIIGAQCAMGWSAEQMLEENRRRWSRRRLLEPAWTGVSLARGERAATLLRELFGARSIPDLPIEFFCTTTDITDCCLHVADRGLVADWVAASSAVPGLWPPFVDGRGHLHVDGGILDNVPTEVMRSRLAGPVVAVDVCATQSPMLADPSIGPAGSLAPLRRRGPRVGGSSASPSLFDVIGRSNLLAGMQTWSRARDFADLYLTPATAPHGFSSFDRVAELEELGYRSTFEQLERGDPGAALELH